MRALTDYGTPTGVYEDGETFVVLLAARGPFNNKVFETERFEFDSLDGALGFARGIRACRHSVYEMLTEAEFDEHNKAENPFEFDHSQPGD